VGPHPVVAPVSAPAAGPAPAPGPAGLGRDDGLPGAARHGVVNLAGVGVAALAGFAVNVVLTRGWSKADAGLFFTATSAFVMAYAIARLGAQIGAVYFVSRLRALGQPERIRPTLLAGVLPVAVASLVIAVVTWVAAPSFAAHLLAQPHPDAVPLLRVLALFVPVAALGEFAYAAGRGFGRMGPLVLVERLGRNLLQLGGVLAAAGLGASVAFGLPLAWAGPYVPATALALGWVAVLTHRAGRAARPTGPVAPSIGSELRPFWRYAAPRALGDVAQMVIQRLDIVLVGALRGVAEAAVYTAATRFLALGQLAGQAVGVAVQHRFAAQLARGDVAGAGRLYQAATGWLVLIAWPAYLLFALFAEPMLAVFGPGFDSGRWVTVTLSLTMLVATGCGMVDQVLNMAGKTTWTLYNALAALAVNVVVNLLLIPRMGILGAAVAWAASILVANLVPLTQLYWSMRLHPFGRGALVAAGLAVGFIGLPGVAVRAAVGPDLVVLVPVVGVAAIAYLATAWRLRGVLQLDALRHAARRRSIGGADE
jgi:O-antigen/teichoic acid export membrane protein